jgi:hypothetical protein
MQVVLFGFFLMISGNCVEGLGLPHFFLFIGPPFPFSSLLVLVGIIGLVVKDTTIVWMG